VIALCFKRSASNRAAGDVSYLMHLRSSQARDREKGVNGEVKGSCIREIMSRCSFLEKTGDDQRLSCMDSV